MKPDQLKSLVDAPQYRRADLKEKIIHIGFGAFHRAHQSVFTEDYLKLSNSDWGVCVASLNNETPIVHLREQDHLFTVTSKGAEAVDVKLIASIINSVHPKIDGVNALIEKIAEPQVEIITLTVTEKGYCIDPVTRNLDLDNEAIISDLQNPAEPKTAIGFIVQGLKKRMERNLPPLSILSCDNIPENGKVAKAVMVSFARQLNHQLAEWIEANITFPSSMVDRITPAMTPSDHAEVEQLIGQKDNCAVICEPFNQWVIEDRFAASRPDWDLAGAQFVDDVVPYEEMKLRMLNGAHSFLAYLGYLAGYTYISDTMEDEAFIKAARSLMIEEQSPSLNMPTGTDINAYANQLIERFSNPNLKHKTWQIAMDGSQKIPQRLGDTLKFQLPHGFSITHICTGIAAWMRYVSGVDEAGNEIEVQDPMASIFKKAHEKHGLNASIVTELLSFNSIFDPKIARDDRVIAAITQAYQALLENGARKTVKNLAAGV